MPTSINNSNSIQKKEAPKKHSRKNIATAGAIMLSLLWAPKESEAKTDITNTTNKELAVTIDQKPIIFDWDEHQNKLRSKEEMTIDFIKNNVYINWKSINDIDGAIVTKKNDKLYSVEFEYNFSEIEWSKKIKLEFNTNYENNSISFDFDNSQIFINNRRVLLKTNASVEINDITHNNYDIRTIWNWKRENFNIVYNDIKTKETIENIVKEKTLTSKIKFEKIDEFENTQLTRLNTPYLWKEVFRDDDWYYRTLFYSTNGKKYDITNVYFKPNWEFNSEKTSEKQEKLTILWMDVDYTITSKGEFVISEESKQALEQKVRQDRIVLIETINNTPVADFEVFSGLNKVEEAWTFQFDSKIISLDPISWIYSIKLNNDKDKSLEPTYSKIEWENLILVDETWRTASNVYFNYETKNKKETNYYRINKWWEWLTITKISKKLENPKEMLPLFKGEGYLVNTLKKSGNLTNFKDGYLNYFDSEWYLIAKIPCNKLEDWGYEFNEEKYHTKIEALKLYKYYGFKNKVQKIDELTTNLWITDAEIREIFEKSLKNDWLDLNQNVVEITNPKTEESTYCKMDKNFKIERDEKLYGMAENRINFMLNRLKLAEIINNSQILRKNGKEYKDFEQFIWWETWIGKQIISPEQLQKFISWETDEITIKISRWQRNYTDIVYTASGKKLTTRLKSGEWKWSVYLNPQWYTIKTEDKTWNIILDPKEERE